MTVDSETVGINVQKEKIKQPNYREYATVEPHSEGFIVFLSLLKVDYKNIET